MSMHAVGDPDGRSDGEGFRLGGGAIAAGSGVSALIIFMLQNTEDVTVTFLFWDFTWPLWLLTLVTAVFGALVWFGLGVVRRRRRRKERRQKRRD
jgi:cytochrome c-type biogenesis protein CcmH/NrfF